MRTIQLHNTLTGKKEALVPLVPGQVSMYVCGITPYDEPHLGHARCYVVFDVLKRALLHFGLKVRHIQNFTDIDDKIIARASESHVQPNQLAETFIRSFEDAMRQLNIMPAEIYPRVTTHIPQILKLISRLVENETAYVNESGVYFSVRKFDAYGRLSKRNIDELTAGARVEVDESKKDPLDFALWKRAKPGEPSWESPWGPGRPGWHIECSAMSTEYLGDDFDLHGGGLDLVFPHHENEIAQSVAATGKKFAHTWVHNGFVTINEEKMSKSIGNFFTIKDILKTFDPMAVRYFLLTQHYRSPLNFSDADLQVAQQTWKTRISDTVHRLASQNGQVAEIPTNGPAAVYLAEFEGALANDLNTPTALGSLNQYITYVNKLETDKAKDANWGSLHAGLVSMLSTLGLLVSKEEPIPAEIQDLLAARQKARSEKQWERSDEIRDELKKRGYVVEDTSSGPRLKKI